MPDRTHLTKTDLIITDFEPLTCHVGHKKRLPVISIDNQHCLTNTVVSYPRKYRGDAAAAKKFYRDFMTSIVANFDNDWEMTGADIDAAIAVLSGNRAA